MKPPPPLEVSGLSHDGRGVARRDGKTVFIAGALPGEQVRCRVTHARARFDEAQLIEVLRASPERRAPRCPHFGHCGGCTLQHLSGEAQLAAHQQQLAGALERIARLQPGHWLAPVASEPFAYRARARLAVAWDAGARRAALGFRRGASRVVEPLDSCPVLAPAAGALIAPLAALIATLAAPGHVREVWLATGEPGLALGVACAPALDATDRARLEAFAAAQGAVLHLGLIAALGEEPQWTEAGPPLRYATAPDGPVLEFQPWHFTQANRGVNRALIAAVLAQLAPGPDDHVLELFCGLGNFTLPLATRAARVTGVEGDAALLDWARRNARANGLANTDSGSTPTTTSRRSSSRASWTPCWEEVEGKIKGVLESLVIDTESDHNTQDTARRVAKMYLTKCSAGATWDRRRSPSSPNAERLNELMIVGPITVRSACSHHFCPIMGRLWIG
jgi:23S rRNA (uracil1939-C5)-methyltransferase